MDKILLIFLGLMFFSGIAFGQKTFGVKTTPKHLDKLKAPPSYPDLLDSSNKWIIVDADLNGKLKLDGTDNSVQLTRPKTYKKKNTTIGYFSDPSNMPIIDLSKNFSSNLPMKKFPEDFPSNMPELDVIMPEN